MHISGTKSREATLNCHAAVAPRTCNENFVPKNGPGGPFLVAKFGCQKLIDPTRPKNGPV